MSAELEKEKAISLQLAKRVIWALKFMDTKGGSGISGGLVSFGATGESMPWEDWFMDALDQYGYVIDRKAFYARNEKPKKPRKKKALDAQRGDDE